MYQTVLEWALSVIGAGGLGSIITYFVTLSSKKRIMNAEADKSEIEVLHDKLDLKLDLCDYLQKLCDKYITDYHKLEEEFRTKMGDLLKELLNIITTNLKEIQDKCIEITTLKTKITYLKGIGCYKFTCPHRITEDPKKEQSE